MIGPILLIGGLAVALLVAIYALVHRLLPDPMSAQLTQAWRRETARIRNQRDAVTFGGRHRQTVAADEAPTESLTHLFYDHEDVTP